MGGEQSGVSSEQLMYVCVQKQSFDLGFYKILEPPPAKHE